MFEDRYIYICEFRWPIVYAPSVFIAAVYTQNPEKLIQTIFKLNSFAFTLTPSQPLRLKGAYF